MLVLRGTSRLYHPAHHGFHPEEGGPLSAVGLLSAHVSQAACRAALSMVGGAAGYLILCAELPQEAPPNLAASTTGLMLHGRNPPRALALMTRVPRCYSEAVDTW